MSQGSGALAAVLTLQHDRICCFCDSFGRVGGRARWLEGEVEGGRGGGRARWKTLLWNIQTIKLGRQKKKSVES